MILGSASVIVCHLVAKHLVTARKSNLLWMFYKAAVQSNSKLIISLPSINTNIYTHHLLLHYMIPLWSCANQKFRRKWINLKINEKESGEKAKQKQIWVPSRWGPCLFLFLCGAPNSSIHPHIHPSVPSIHPSIYPFSESIFSSPLLSLTPTPLHLHHVFVLFLSIPILSLTLPHPHPLTHPLPYDTVYPLPVLYQFHVYICICTSPL